MDISKKYTEGSLVRMLDFFGQQSDCHRPRGRQGRAEDHGDWQTEGISNFEDTLAYVTLSGAKGLPGM